MQNTESRRRLIKVGLWWAALNAILLLIISIKYMGAAPEATSLGENIYRHLFNTAHCCFLSIIPFLFVYIPATILSKNHTKACMLWGAGAYTVFLIVMVVDAYVYSLYRFHLNSTVVEQMAGPGATQVFELSFQLYIAALLGLALLYLLQVALFKASNKIEQNIGSNKPQIALCVSVAVLIAAIQIAHATAAAYGNRAITRNDRIFALCKPLNINSLLNKIGFNTPLKYRYDFFKENRYNYPQNDLICTERQDKKQNIIFLTLDSWIYTSLDSATCPNLYKLSQQSASFTHHYSGGNCTRNGVFSMFYALPGVFWYNFKDQHITPVFIDELQRQNYDIKLYPSATLKNPAFSDNAFHSLPDTLCDATPGSKAWERDRNLAQRFIKDIENRDSTQPLFAFLFFDSLHSMILPDSSEFNAPFRPTWTFPDYMQLDNNTDAKPFFNLYKNMLRYIDNYVGKIVEAMQRNGMMDNTVLIVTGDHGQEFNENGKNFWGHNGNFSAEQVQVPFLYFKKGMEPAKYTHWTSHHDMVPTLMHDVLGVQNTPSDYSIGKNLFDTTPRRFMYSDGYNGFAITEENGNITDMFYDGEYQITDKKLNHLTSKELDTDRVNEVVNTIYSFYK